MMGGFGVLKQMNDTLKANRELLGKKKSIREIYKDEVRKRTSTEDNQNLEYVRQRVAKTLKRNRVKEIISQIIVITTLVGVVIGIIWGITRIDFTPAKRNRYKDKSVLFSTKIYDHSEELELKKDYFPGGPKASETFLKEGLKHQNSESYYESGEQFRSALYYYDTLITDIYFYKSGDTIKNFPAIYDQEVHHITLNPISKRKKIEFDFYDGKIIGGTYYEWKITN
jgi:hypothetical protein